MPEATWLDAGQVSTVLGADLASSVDQTALQEYADAARSYVEKKRADLFNDADPAVYVPTPDVKVGAALLAYRWYQRRTTPLGVVAETDHGVSGILRHDPDIARLLGIGGEGRFVFGAGRARVVES